MDADETKLAPADDGYRLTPVASRVFVAGVIVCCVALAYLPREYTVLRMLAFGGQMLIMGIAIAHRAPIWTRPRLTSK